MVKHHVSFCCSLVNFIMVMIALIVPLIITGTCDLNVDQRSGALSSPTCHTANVPTYFAEVDGGVSIMGSFIVPGSVKMDYDVGIWGTCYRMKYGTYFSQTVTDWTCNTWPSGVEYIYTYKTNTLNGYFVISAMKSQLQCVQGLYTTAAVSCFLALLCAGATYASHKAAQAAAFFYFLAGAMLLSVACYLTSSMHSNDTLGWNYTYVYAWIGWLQNWGSVAPALSYYGECDSEAKGDDAHGGHV
jgi:hypothetical protein